MHGDEQAPAVNDDANPRPNTNVEPFEYVLNAELQELAAEHVRKATTSLELVLKAHLLAEGLLDQILVETLMRPDRLDLSRASFAQKLSLAVATGGLAAELEAPVRALNRKRNKIAHDLHEGVDETFEFELRSSFDADGQRLLEGIQTPEEASTSEFPEWLRLCLHLLLLMMDQSCQRQVWLIRNRDAVARQEVFRYLRNIR